MSKIRFTGSGEPATPPSGAVYVFVDTADSHLKQKDDTGAVTDLAQDITNEYASQAEVDAGTVTDKSISPATFGGSAQLEGKIDGPAASVSGNIATFDGVSGKIAQDSGYATTDFATAAQGGLADSALQGTDIGTEVQAWDTHLDSIAGLVPGVEGKMITSDGLGAYQISTAAGVRGYLNVEDGAEVNTVDSVNTQTGAVVLDADDVDDTATTHRFVTAADQTNLENLSGTNTGDQVGDGTTITGAGTVGDPFVSAGGGAETFTDLTDTPSAYAGCGGCSVVVNAGATGLEFAAGGGGGGCDWAGSGTDAIQIGESTPSTATGNLSVAVGDAGCAAGYASVSLGYLAKNVGHCSVAIGWGACNYWADNVAIGKCAKPTGGTDSVAIGKCACSSSGSGTVMIGAESCTTGCQSVAVGQNSRSGKFSASLGALACATAFCSIAVGRYACVSIDKGQSYGYFAKAGACAAHTQGHGLYNCRPGTTAWDVSTEFANDKKMVGVGRYSATTTNATSTPLTAIGVANQRFCVASGAVVGFNALVAGTDSTSGSTTVCCITGAIKNVGGTTSIVGTPTCTTIADESGGSRTVSVAANDTTDNLEINVVGDAAATVAWVSKIDFVDVRQ